MAASNQVELVVVVGVDGANKSIKTVNSSFASMEQAAVSATAKATVGLNGLEGAMTRSVAVGNVLSNVFQKMLGWLKEYGAEVVTYAARTQTMGVVSTQLAKVNGYNADAVQRLVERIKALGISTQEAHGTVQRMIFAQLDLTKATDLARVAQDAAVIAGVNSSEALENIILGVTTGQTRLLHTMGLQVSLEHTIQEETRKRGHALSESEKREAMLNKVLEEGVKIRGSYEAAMGTAGKQQTSMVRLWQEAKNALGDQFLPQFTKLIRMMSEFLEWTKNNADMFKTFVSYFAAAATGAAIATFIGWIVDAKIAVVALNAAMAVNPWIAGGMLIGAGVYAVNQQYDDYKERQKRMEADMRDRTIRGAIAKGKSKDDLKSLGFSDQQIKDAITGRRLDGDKENPGEKVDDSEFRYVFNKRQKTDEQLRLEAEAAEFAKDLAKRRQRHVADMSAGLQNESLASGKEGLTGYAKDIAAMNAHLEKITTFQDKNDVEHRVPLSPADMANVMTTMQNKFAAWQKDVVDKQGEYVRDYLEKLEEADNKIFQDRNEKLRDAISHNAETAEGVLGRIYNGEEQRLGLSKDAVMRQVEATNAQTIQQKVAVEQRKAAIEVEYLQKVHEVKNKLFDLETSRLLREEEATLRKLEYRVDEIKARLSALTSERATIKGEGDSANDEAIRAARENAAIHSAEMVRDHYRSIFDSLKDQAGGVFDALIQKSQSVWSAIGNSLKTALLTAIKDVVTSRIAMMLINMFYPGAQGRLQSNGGIGSVPVFGAAASAVGMMGGGGGGTVPFLPSGVGSAQMFGGGSGGGAGLMAIPGLGTAMVAPNGSMIPVSLGPGGTAPFFANLSTARSGGSGFGGFNLSPFKGANALKTGGGIMAMLGGTMMLGGVQSGSAAKTIGGGALMGAGIGLAGGPVGAIAGVGAGLFLDAMRRGGAAGVGEATLGGAMVGFNIAGPLGAAIGAGIGFVAGVVRLFVKGAQEKLRQKIKSTYGVDVSDSAVLKSILEMAKQNYGGNVDMAIRAKDVRDMIMLYAQSTGQSARNMGPQMTSLSLAQSGGGLFQNPGYVNGSQVAGLGGLPTIDAINRGGAANGGGGGTTVIPLSIDSTAVGTVIVRNGQVISQGAMSAMKSNSNRRELTALQLNPGLLTS